MTGAVIHGSSAEDAEIENAVDVELGWLAAVDMGVVFSGVRSPVENDSRVIILQRICLLLAESKLDLRQAQGRAVDGGGEDFE
jgi:hypothetical protein